MILGNAKHNEFSKTSGMPLLSSRYNIWACPRFAILSCGGRIPGFVPDERIIKVLTGERILSRGQNKKFEAGEYDSQVIEKEFQPLSLINIQR